MKDKEMAEEIANKRCHEIMCYGHCSFNSPKHHRCGEWHREYNCALEGLKAGRPKWHKVADGDLPKPNIGVLICMKFENGWTSTYIAYYRHANKKWQMYNLHEAQRQPIVDDYIDTEEVIAWCEIPTFDKE